MAVHHTEHLVAAMLNRWVERICVTLLVLLVLDVWAGIVARYALDASLPWTEELARYLMIWMALLAVSVGIYHREHIGLDLLRQKLPFRARRYLRAAFDVIGLLFFSVIFWFGLSMTATGSSQYANIFGMTMALPFAAVPVSAALACIQLILRGVKDFRALVEEDAETAS